IYRKYGSRDMDQSLLVEDCARVEKDRLGEEVQASMKFRPGTPIRGVSTLPS
ncbi:hypothetical protein BgiMline_029036, partial [Biomphalaria glabrata]